VAGAVVAVVVVVGFGPPGLLLPRVTVCALGAPIGTYTIWTLDQPLNKPPGVNVSATAESGAWNFTFVSGSLTVGALHPGNSAFGWGADGPMAGISSMGAEINWTVFGVSNTSVIGSAPGSCTQPYVAEEDLAQAPPCGGFVTIPLANNSSDAVEPHVWNGTGETSWNPASCPHATAGAYIWFDTSFHAEASGVSAPVSWDLCGQSGEFPLILAASAEIPVVVNVPYDGREVAVHGFESWLGGQFRLFGPSGGTTANYTVPGGWTWMLAPVGPVSIALNPGAYLPSLVAFERLPC
jgi:hypothetical protein